MSFLKNQKSLKQRYNSYRYRNYQRLTRPVASRRVTVEQNTINETTMEVDFLILEKGVKFINRGTINGIVIARGDNFRNEGLMSGVFIGLGMLFNSRKTGKFIGTLATNELIIEPGSTFEGDIVLFGGKTEITRNSPIIESVENTYTASKAQEVLSILKS